MASAAPPGREAVFSHMFSTWAGGALWVQMALWRFRPQHPLRLATAECWQEAANWVEILNHDSWSNAIFRTMRSAAQQAQFLIEISFRRPGKHLLSSFLRREVIHLVPSQRVKMTPASRKTSK